MSKKRDHITRIAAEIHGVSPSYVRKIRQGERDNDEILATVMDLKEGESKLIAEVKRLVPMGNSPRKRRKTTLGELQKGASCTQNNEISKNNIGN